LWLNPHKIGDVFMWCLKEYLLKMWQIHASVGGPSKKFINEDTIVTQDSKDFLKRGPQNGQPIVIKFEYLVMPTRRGKCLFEYVPLHWEE